MSDRYLVRDPLVSIRNQPKAQLKYVTKQRVGGNKVVFWLAIENAALIQQNKLKKETAGIAYIDIINEIIPGHAFKISRESDQIERRLSNRCPATSITYQTLRTKGNCKNRKEHEEKLCRLAILRTEAISVEKWEAGLHSTQLKLEKA